LINSLVEINFDLYYFFLCYVLQTLQEYFKTNQYPTRQSKAILAEELSLTYEQVHPPPPSIKKREEKEKNVWEKYYCYPNRKMGQVKEWKKKNPFFNFNTCTSRSTNGLRLHGVKHVVPQQKHQIGEGVVDHL
jgi:Homeodomain